MTSPSGYTTADGLTVHGARKTGATSFINLVRSGRTNNYLRWKPKHDGEAPAYTPDNCGLLVFADPAAELPDAFDAKKEYVIPASCTIQPAKNWALVVPTAELFEVADVSLLSYVVPGDVHEPVFRIRPRFKLTREELNNMALAYVLLIA